MPTRGTVLHLLAGAAIMRADDGWFHGWFGKSNARWFKATPVSPYYDADNEKHERLLDVREYGSNLHELHTALSARKLLEIGREHRDAFSDARPYPHIYLDHLFPDRCKHREARTNGWPSS